MINVYRWRATGDERDWTIFDVPRGVKSFVDMVQNRIKKSSKAMTDEHPVAGEFAIRSRLKPMPSKRPGFHGMLSGLLLPLLPGYKKPGEAGYGHAAVNRGEGEYTSGPDNETHSNDCECRAGLPRWRMGKRLGVSKWHLESCAKAFQFVHNHHT